MCWCYILEMKRVIALLIYIVPINTSTWVPWTHLLFKMYSTLLCCHTVTLPTVCLLISANPFHYLFVWPLLWHFFCTCKSLPANTHLNAVTPSCCPLLDSLYLSLTIGTNSYPMALWLLYLLPANIQSLSLKQHSTPLRCPICQIHNTFALALQHLPCLQYSLPSSFCCPLSAIYTWLNVCHLHLTSKIIYYP